MPTKPKTKPAVPKGKLPFPPAVKGKFPVTPKAKKPIK